MSWEPLPEGTGANPLVRRLRAIDAEIFGHLYAHSGTIGGNVTIEGDIISANWGGANPANLATPDTSGTPAGFYLDSSAGAAQFSGNMWIGGDIELLGGGTVRTGGSSDARLELIGLASASYREFSGMEWYAKDNGGSSVHTASDIVQNADAATLARMRKFAFGTSESTHYVSMVYEAFGPTLTLSLTSSGNTLVSADAFLGDCRFGDGSVSTPGLRASSETGTGIYIPGTNQIAIAINGTQEFLLGATGLKIPNVYTGYTSSANVNVETDGSLRRATSALKYKKNVEDAPWLADIQLRPIEFDGKENNMHYYGLLADDVAEVLPLAGVYNTEGGIEDYDTRAVIAILVAKVNRLEEQLNGTN